MTVAEQPIGIFDSGVGGLTVAHQIHQLLPQESLIYFGDVAHHPYGEKSVAEIQTCSLKICDFLFKQNCKMIVIACHSASSAAYEVIQAQWGKQVLIVNVIDPVIHYLPQNFLHKTVGVIGTRQTIQSKIYPKKMAQLTAEIQLQTLATPLLAPMIEEGYANHLGLFYVLKDYLNHPSLSTIDALLLGCTHYPLIKKQILQHYQRPITLIDSAEITAQAVKNLLEQQQLNYQGVHTQQRFYVSDYTAAFVANAQYFFPQAIHFEQYALDA